MLEAYVRQALDRIGMRPSRERGQHFLIDDAVLEAAGVTDLDRYAVDPSQPLLPDLFLG